MKRSKFEKAKLNAERAQQAEKRKHRRDPDVKRGFRKIHFGIGVVYLWRPYGDKVEIRTPNDQKWLVSIWQIQGHKTEEAWLKEHEECCREGCCDPCFANWVQPGMIRDYIAKRTV